LIVTFYTLFFSSSRLFLSTTWENVPYNINPPIYSIKSIMVVMSE
jgi:hypothetical protein